MLEFRETSFRKNYYILQPNDSKYLQQVRIKCYGHREQNRGRLKTCSYSVGP